MRPEGEQPHLWEYLTHDEWALCFCLAFTTTTDQATGSYKIDAHPTPGTEGPTDDWNEKIKRTIRYLHREHSYAFSGVNVHRDGRLTVAERVEPGNRRYLLLFQLAMAFPEGGFFPDVDVLLPRAVLYAEERVPSLDIEPMRDVATELEQEIQQRIAAAPPDALRREVAARERLMQETRDFLVQRELERQPVH